MGRVANRMACQMAWETDVRIRIRPGRADSGVKLYVTDRDETGAREFMANTGFMRYPRLFSTLATLLSQCPAGQGLRVLIVPLSVGLEAVSLAIAGREAGLFAEREVTVEGFDISQKATELAAAGVYPRLFFPEDLSPYDHALHETGDGYVEIAPALMERIGVLPAGDVLTFAPQKPYDMVVCLNLLMHLPEEARPRLVERLAAMTAPGGILCVNNNQEWPAELAPYFARLTARQGGFVSLHGELEHGPVPEGSSEPAPDFAVTDANAMILRKAAP